MLLDEHRAYLRSRTYTDELIDREPIESDGELIRWRCESAAGTHIGDQTLRPGTHEYRWDQAPQAHHLPIIYGTEEDHEGLFQTGQVILVEGIFDRAAIKRIAPGRACYARLSRGIAKHLLTTLRRYGTTVFLLFDQDGPGRAATEDAERKLSGGPEVHQLRIPAKDPAALLEKVGERRAQGIILPQIQTWEH